MRAPSGRGGHCSCRSYPAYVALVAAVYERRRAAIPPSAVAHAHMTMLAMRHPHSMLGPVHMPAAGRSSTGSLISGSLREDGGAGTQAEQKPEPDEQSSQLHRFISFSSGGSRRRRNAGLPLSPVPVPHGLDDADVVAPFAYHGGAGGPCACRDDGGMFAALFAGLSWSLWWFRRWIATRIGLMRLSRYCLDYRRRSGQTRGVRRIRRT